MQSPIAIGVVGVGHLGKRHLQHLLKLNFYNVVGFYDIDEKTQKEVANTYGVAAFQSYEMLLKECDAILIATPTLTHYWYAAEAIKAGKHVFIEKPVTATLEEAQSLLQLSKEANVVVQVGHVERFNPAYLALQSYSLAPTFIDCQRLAQWNPRGTDVSVVLDLMIHDLDIVLQLIPTKIRRISAWGVTLMSDSPDIVNARLEFINNAIVNLTANRIALTNVRKMELYQDNQYIIMDFLKRQSYMFSLTDTPRESPATMVIEKNGKTKFWYQEAIAVPDVDAIQQELKSFAQAILNAEEPPVTLYQAYRTLEIAHRITEKIEHVAL